ncbi:MULTISPECIES: hypothetical protein [Actinopolyspora]|uniref:Tetratricopeptide repeat-containing protein n=1 Tax=Actinopolyspora saharensis TaxID=995062 RepID=A0A1H1AVE1_9ACTN|nr:MULTISPECIES: hypothetical protein [Actinopolyspora]NHD17158.1 hypothetical protein [Actinopolyspora sp. BKK2]NHE76310.1 hypothetical protein [Actinopolyspora sp. BKK1]SDQ43630.1 hypothetical protein SAMN04489718_1752 [Actinopolyspora saharensis]
MSGGTERRARVFGPRFYALLIAVVLLVYLVLMGSRAVTMLLSGKPLVIVLGVAVLVLPVLGAVLVADQIRFGVRTQRLAGRLADEDALPDHSHLPLRPSGRVRRDAADEWFEQKRAEMEREPEDWRVWFALAQAYDLAGDRNRGRQAMRKAIDLEQRERVRD